MGSIRIQIGYGSDDILCLFGSLWRHRDIAYIEFRPRTPELRLSAIDKHYIGDILCYE